MRITDVAKLVGVMPDEIRWLEKKGYVKPRWKTLKKRRVRDYPEAEVQKLELIVKYRREGYEHAVAYQKAKEELERPRLL